MPRSLYICYFGLREPLVQTQVLPYLREIQKGGTEVSILTFEADPKANWTAESIEKERSLLASEGIDWRYLTYHKRPSAPATLFDVFCGAWLVWREHRRKPIDIIHARVHTPALMGAIAKFLAFGKKPKLLFDIRGFFPEEYVDAGIWPESGSLYRSVKRVERWLLKVSDGFVVLTERARSILFPNPDSLQTAHGDRPVEVIPCCVDIGRFADADPKSRVQMRASLGIGNRFAVAYVGATGGWYLTQEMADFFGVLKKKSPDAFALILTQSDPDEIRDHLTDSGYRIDEMLIRKVKPGEIPAYLSTADAAVSFIKPCYSKQASSPTKNAEYLACGLPIVANDGIGDTTEQIEADQTGVVIREFSTSAYEKAIDGLFDLLRQPQELADRCRKSALERFDLATVGGPRYRRIYERLLENE